MADKEKTINTRAPRQLLLLFALMLLAIFSQPIYSQVFCPAGLVPSYLFVTQSDTSVAKGPTYGELDFTYFYINNSTNARLGVPNEPIYILEQDPNSGAVSYMCKYRSDGTGSGTYSFPNNLSNCINFQLLHCYDSQDSAQLRNCIGNASVQWLIGKNYLSSSTNLDTDPYSTLFNSVPVCDGSQNFGGVSTSQVYSSAATSAQYCNPQQYNLAESLCWPVLVVFGLLLGAMFMVGRNPISGFDLGSPRFDRGRVYQMRNLNFSMQTVPLANIATGGVTLKGASKDKDGKDVPATKIGGLFDIKIGGKTIGDAISGAGQSITQDSFIGKGIKSLFGGSKPPDTQQKIDGNATATQSGTVNMSQGATGTLTNPKKMMAPFAQQGGFKPNAADNKNTLDGGSGPTGKPINSGAQTTSLGATSQSIASGTGTGAFGNSDRSTGTQPKSFTAANQNIATKQTGTSDVNNLNATLTRPTGAGTGAFLFTSGNVFGIFQGMIDLFSVAFGSAASKKELKEKGEAEANVDMSVGGIASGLVNRFMGQLYLPGFAVDFLGGMSTGFTLIDHNTAQQYRYSEYNASTNSIVKADQDKLDEARSKLSPDKQVELNRLLMTNPSEGKPRFEAVEKFLKDNGVSSKGIFTQASVLENPGEMKTWLRSQKLFIFEAQREYERNNKVNLFPFTSNTNGQIKTELNDAVSDLKGLLGNLTTAEKSMLQDAALTYLAASIGYNDGQLDAIALKLKTPGLPKEEKDEALRQQQKITVKQQEVRAQLEIVKASPTAAVSYTKKLLETDPEAGLRMLDGKNGVAASQFTAGKKEMVQAIEIASSRVNEYANLKTYINTFEGVVQVSDKAIAELNRLQEDQNKRSEDLKAVKKLEKKLEIASKPASAKKGFAHDRLIIITATIKELSSKPYLDSNEAKQLNDAKEEARLLPMVGYADYDAVPQSEIEAARQKNAKEQSKVQVLINGIENQRAQGIEIDFTHENDLKQQKSNLLQEATQLNGKFADTYVIEHDKNYAEARESMAHQINVIQLKKENLLADFQYAVQAATNANTGLDLSFESSKLSSKAGFGLMDDLGDKATKLAAQKGIDYGAAMSQVQGQMAKDLSDEKSRLEKEQANLAKEQNDLNSKGTLVESPELNKRLSEVSGRLSDISARLGQIDDTLPLMGGAAALLKAESELYGKRKGELEAAKQQLNNLLAQKDNYDQSGSGLPPSSNFRGTVYNESIDAQISEVNKQIAYLPYQIHNEAMMELSSQADMLMQNASFMANTLGAKESAGDQFNGGAVNLGASYALSNSIMNSDAIGTHEKEYRMTQLANSASQMNSAMLEVVPVVAGVRANMAAIEAQKGSTDAQEAQLKQLQSKLDQAMFAFGSGVDKANASVTLGDDATLNRDIAMFGALGKNTSTQSHAFSQDVDWEKLGAKPADIQNISNELSAKLDMQRGFITAYFTGSDAIKTQKQEFKESIDRVIELSYAMKFKPLELNNVQAQQINDISQEIIRKAREAIATSESKPGGAITPDNVTSQQVVDYLKANPVQVEAIASLEVYVGGATKSQIDNNIHLAEMRQSQAITTIKQQVAQQLQVEPVALESSVKPMMHKVGDEQVAVVHPSAQDINGLKECLREYINDNGYTGTDYVTGRKVVFKAIEEREGKSELTDQELNKAVSTIWRWADTKDVAHGISEVKEFAQNYDITVKGKVVHEAGTELSDEDALKYLKMKVVPVRQEDNPLEYILKDYRNAHVEVKFDYTKTTTTDVHNDEWLYASAHIMQNSNEALAQQYRTGLGIATSAIYDDEVIKATRRINGEMAAYKNVADKQFDDIAPLQYKTDADSINKLYNSVDKANDDYKTIYSESNKAAELIGLQGPATFDVDQFATKALATVGYALGYPATPVGALFGLTEHSKTETLFDTATFRLSNADTLGRAYSQGTENQASENAKEIKKEAVENAMSGGSFAQQQMQTIQEQMSRLNARPRTYAGED